MGTFGLTLANRGVIIGAVTVPELFDMAKRGEDSGAFDAVWVGDASSQHLVTAAEPQHMAAAPHMR